MNAIKRAEYIFNNVVINELPPILESLYSKYADENKDIFRPFVLYAMFVEKLDCNDYQYEPTQKEIDWFAERGYVLDKSIADKTLTNEWLESLLEWDEITKNKNGFIEYGIRFSTNLLTIRISDMFYDSGYAYLSDYTRLSNKIRLGKFSTQSKFLSLLDVLGIPYGKKDEEKGQKSQRWKFGVLKRQVDWNDDEIRTTKRMV